MADDDVPVIIHKVLTLHKPVGATEGVAAFALIHNRLCTVRNSAKARKSLCVGILEPSQLMFDVNFYRSA